MQMNYSIFNHPLICNACAQAEILREAEVMAGLDHPHIVRLVGEFCIVFKSEFCVLRRELRTRCHSQQDQYTTSKTLHSILKLSMQRKSGVTKSADMSTQCRRNAES